MGIVTNMVFDFTPFNKLQLDLAGVVAILGEGSVLRNAEAASLSWMHVLPRLLPAPQALIRHERAKRLPTASGTVIGAYSGNTKSELNFFASVLHPKQLGRNEVELVKVTRKNDTQGREAFGVAALCPLSLLQILGFLMSITLIGLSIYYRDGFAFVAVILLSLTSTVVGFASRWTLLFDYPKPVSKRKAALPDGDVVIYYPAQGAFRIIQCDEDISRLYFRTEKCVHYLGGKMYRVFAVTATWLLMGGLICIGSAGPTLQVALVACYVVLNALYWASSAVDPARWHWQCHYEANKVNINRVRNATENAAEAAIVARSSATHLAVPEVLQTRAESEISRDEENGSAEKINHITHADRTSSSTLLKQVVSRRLGSWGTTRKVLAERAKLHPEDRDFTTALWMAIALTETTRWLKGTHIAPNNDAWRRWVFAAAEAAKEGSKEDKQGKETWIVLPGWDCNAALTQYLREHQRLGRGIRPNWTRTLLGVKAIVVFKTRLQAIRSQKASSDISRDDALLRRIERLESLLDGMRRISSDRHSSPSRPNESRSRPPLAAAGGQFEDEDDLYFQTS